MTSKQIAVGKIEFLTVGSAQPHCTGEKINVTYCSGVCEGRPDMKLRHSSGAEDTCPLSTMLPASDLLLPAVLDSDSFSSTFFPGANFSALSSKALRATLLKTFP